MKKTLLHFLKSFLFIFLIVGCSGGRNYRAQLERADSLMTAHPDSAYAILTSIDSADIHNQRKAIRIRYELLRAEAQNKLYVPFTTDSVMRKVAAYYNHPLHRLWTSPNDRLRALYVLGCVYRDLHEAPIALLTWEEAIAAADTTAVDCDYATLFRVYGQMAEIYKWQHLPEKQLEVQKQMSRYAFLAGDTLNYLRGRLLCNSAYYALGDTAAIYANSQAVRQHYLELGLSQEAAKVYPVPIHVTVEAGLYKRARRMMDEYEQHSGLFDEKGNIKVRSRVQYYYYKGLYYLGVNEIDSAELQFQKLLQDSIHFMDACRGLFTLYQNIHDTDSAFKYGCLYEEAMSRFLDNQNGEAIIQAQAMYDYQRQEKIAAKERKKNQFLTSITVLLCLAAISSFLYSRRKRKAKVEAMRKLELAFAQTEEDLESTKAELRLLRSCVQDVEDQNLIIQKLEERIRRQESQLKHDAQILGKLDVIERDQRLMSDETVLLFQRICHPHKETRNGKAVKKFSRKAYKKEWIELFKTIKKEHLSCYIAIEGCESLSPQERQVAYLSRINLQTQEMATIIGCLPQSISNSRSGISHKLFKSDDTLKINKKLKEL